MRLLLFHFFFLLTTTKSCNNDTLSIAILNKTSHNITSFKMYVQGKEYRVANIQPYETSKLEIRLTDLKLNNHNFRIETKHKNKDSIVINGLYYSDLSGNPSLAYKVEVYDLKTVIK